MDLKSKIYRLPIIIFSAIVPLIVFGKSIKFDREWYYAYNGLKSFTDFFSYYKMIWITISLVLGIIIMLISTKKDDYIKLFKPLINKILIAMMGIVLLTAILSEFKFIVWFGYIDRYEGAIVCFAYLFFVLYINNFVKNSGDLKWIITPIIISSTIIAVIGVFQIYGFNFFSTSVGQSLISGNMASNQILDVAEKTYGTSTLYNPNYVGSYTAMTVFLGLALFMSAKGKNIRLMRIVYILIMIFLLIKSGSSAGLLGLLSGGLIVIAVFCRNFVNKINLKKIMIFILPIIIIFSILTPRLSKEFMRIQNQFERSAENVNFEFLGNRVIFTKDDQKFKIMLSKERFIFVLNDNEIYRKSIELKDLRNQGKKDKNSIININNKFINENFTITYKENINSLVVNLKPSFVIVLEATQDGLNLRDFSGRPLEYQSEFEEFKPLDGKEFFGSSRGYIWKMSIPIVKDNFIIGKGADTFPVVYPQHDLVGKRRFMKRAYMFIDKPHNMYIQMGVNFGGIYLILYLIFIGIYFVESVKLYLINKIRNNDGILGVMIFCSILAYNIAGIFNDSVVSVSPLYWTFVGMGIYINSYNKKMMSKVF